MVSPALASLTRLLAANITSEQSLAYRNAQQALAADLWPAAQVIGTTVRYTVLQGEELNTIWPNLTSLVIVRHPLAR